MECGAMKFSAIIRREVFIFSYTATHRQKLNIEILLHDGFRAPRYEGAMMTCYYQCSREAAFVLYGLLS